MEYDLVVIGGGPGGYVAAVTGAKYGLKTLLIERDLPGGTCLNRGCIPTKALLYCTERYEEAKNGGVFGVRASVDPFDFEAALKHKESTMDRLRKGVESLVKRSGGDLLYGTAVLRDTNTIQVRNEIIGFTDLIVATGSVPAPLPFIVEDGSPLVDSDGFLTLKEIPQSCLVVGAGVIGLEFATILARIGRSVDVIEAADRILPTMDPELGSMVRRSLEARGVIFHTGSFVQRLGKKGSHAICTIKQGEDIQTLKADLAIGAVGRIGNTKDLGPDRAGLIMRKSFIETDDRCATSTPHIYAIGDVNGRFMLAHAASYQGMMVARNIAEGKNRSILNASVPGCVYTDPELASIGLTEEEARTKISDVRVARFDAVGNGRMCTLGRKDGMVKLITSGSTGELLGAQIAAPHASDLIAELAVAIRLEGTVSELADTIHPHPTISEMIMEAAGSLKIPQ